MDDRAPDDAALDALVGRAADGDGGAFADLYDRFAPRVRRFLCHQVGDPDLAEDLLQRTFLKMIEGLPTYRSRGLPFGAWVFRIARNTAIDQWRTARPSSSLDAAMEIAAAEGDPVATAERNADADRIRGALRSLPADQRDVLVWRFYAQLTPAETALLMSRSPGAVRTLQHRALTALRQLVDDVGALGDAEAGR
jgi:RNA polymerase sigma-70 factor (ECF subfamily)